MKLLKVDTFDIYIWGGGGGGSNKGMNPGFSK